jgi:hypothetical protein
MAYFKGIKSGNIIETYKYEKTPQVAKRRHRVPKTADNKRDCDSSKRREDNLRRLRKGFIRLVRSNCVGNINPTLLTLTMRECVSVSVANKCYAKWAWRLRNSLETKEAQAAFRYIGVPEFQKRGAVHYHVLVWGLPDEWVFNETPYAAWCKKVFKQPKLVRRYVDWCFERYLDPRTSRGSRYLQRLWGYGFVDCVPTDGSAALAGYLAKYMSKTMQDSRLNGKRAYNASRNVLRPVSFESPLFLENADVIWGVDSELVNEREFSTMWLGRCIYKRFNLVDHEN